MEMTRRKILLIDDDQLIRESLEEALAREKYLVSATAQGRRGL